MYLKAKKYVATALERKTKERRNRSQTTKLNAVSFCERFTILHYLNSIKNKNVESENSTKMYKKKTNKPTKKKIINDICKML